MLIAVIPPHVRPHERRIIWSVLEGHNLLPVPLEMCEKQVLTPEQVKRLCDLMGHVPIPAYKPDQDGYTLIELRTPNPAARSFLNDALSSRIDGTSRIPLWEGGKKRYRTVRLRGHPQAFLREILIVPPDETTKGLILDYFRNNETPGVAA